MAKKRTRRQKQKISKKRKLVAKAATLLDNRQKERNLNNGSADKSSQQMTASLNKIFGFDIKLIYQDLRKTILVTAITVIILLIIKFYL
ncbi:MAG: hypothetical protein PVJ09_03570 [Candidatus Woesebacteria bacterium]|jgi:hypothetical protein